MKCVIWVVCFENSEHLSSYSKQLLYKAHSLCEANESIITAICIGNQDLNILQSLSKYGASEVFYSRLKDIDYRRFSFALVDLYHDTDYKPNLILFPTTQLSKSVAADLAIRVEAGLTAECMDIEGKKINYGYQFIFTRAAINSSVLVKIQCINTSVGICTCKKDMFTVGEMLPDKNIPISELKSKNQHLSVMASRILYSKRMDDKKDNAKLGNSNIIFGIGRGVKEKDLPLIRQVANKYNAAITGTRAVVEEGLIEKRWQVGQSGISISPDIYVAIGISGATQHIVGIKNAKKIISINKDSNAPIFTYSDYCFIEDYRKILNKLMEN